MSSSTKNMNKVKFCLNSYEQQVQIESRLKELFDCLKISDQIRTKTEQSKQKIKDKLDNTYEKLKDDLSKLSNKIFKKFEIELIKNQIDLPIRSTENDINQLIGNLNSLSLLNDSEKLLCLKQIDNSIQKIKEKYLGYSFALLKLNNFLSSLKSIENHRQSHVDNFYSSQHHLNSVLKNQIENIQYTIQTESINLNSHMLNHTENFEYEKWLLPLKNKDNTESDLKKTNSFEFINYDKEWAEVLEDFDDCDSDVINKELKINSCVNFNIQERFGMEKKDAITKLLNNIYAKPIDFWLLNQS